MIDCQRDLFISGDFDRVVLLFTRVISDYQRDLFFCGDLSVASVSLIGISVHRDRIRTTTTTTDVVCFIKSSSFNSEFII